MDLGPRIGAQEEGRWEGELGQVDLREHEGFTAKHLTVGREEGAQTHKTGRGKAVIHPPELMSSPAKGGHGGEIFNWAKETTADLGGRLGRSGWRHGRLAATGLCVPAFSQIPNQISFCCVTIYIYTYRATHK